MFTQFSPMLSNEVLYRAETYKKEAQQARLVRQAKQGREVKRQGGFDLLAGFKKGRLSFQKGL